MRAGIIIRTDGRTLFLPMFHILDKIERLIQNDRHSSFLFSWGGTVIPMETLMKATLVKNLACGLLELRDTINIYK